MIPSDKTPEQNMEKEAPSQSGHNFDLYSNLNDLINDYSHDSVKASILMRPPRILVDIPVLDGIQFDYQEPFVSLNQ